MVSKRWFEFGPESKFRHPMLTSTFTSVLPQFYLCLTSFLPQSNLSAQPAISNHGLETTVYKPLDICDLCRNVLRHENSDHLASFKERGFLTLPISWR